MKKTIALLLAAGIVSFYACGPSAEEIAAREKAVADSIAAVDAAKKAEEEAKMKAEAEAKAAEAAAAAAKATADSIEAAKNKKMPMKKKEAKKDEPVRNVQKR